MTFPSKTSHPVRNVTLALAAVAVAGAGSLWFALAGTEQASPSRKDRPAERLAAADTGAEPARRVESTQSRVAREVREVVAQHLGPKPNERVRTTPATAAAEPVAIAAAATAATDARMLEDGSATRAWTTTTMDSDPPASDFSRAKAQRPSRDEAFLFGQGPDATEAATFSRIPR